MQFEWDPAKADSNQKKHSVSFAEATGAFADPLSTAFFDPDHSREEERYILVGMSSSGRLLVVAHTDRGDRIRIISAREATRQERSFYEEQA